MNDIIIVSKRCPQVQIKTKDPLDNNNRETFN